MSIKDDTDLALDALKKLAEQSDDPYLSLDAAKALIRYYHGPARV